jgi:hypothetical protein
MAAKTYIVYNGPMATTAPPTKVATGTATKTMLQISPIGMPIRPIAWGVSFDGSAAATPGYCELIDTGTVFGTVTAYAAADIQKYGDPNAPTPTTGASGVPLATGTALSGYTATAEGTATATRMADLQLVAPTNQYLQQWPLGREFEVPVGDCLRIRMTFAATVNALCWVLFEV